MQSWIVDGTAGEEFGSVYYPIFSADEKHHAYVAVSAGRKMYLVVDGKKLGPFDAFPALSAVTKSGKAVFSAVTGGKPALYIGDRKWDLEICGHVMLNGDEKKVAAPVSMGRRWIELFPRSLLACVRASRAGNRHRALRPRRAPRAGRHGRRFHGASFQGDCDYAE